jgi:hypothetical protein
MATRTSLYSFQNNIIEIAISIDAIGALHSPNEPITKAERLQFGLLDGDNPWKHLGVPNFVIAKSPPESNGESAEETTSKSCPTTSSFAQTYVEEARKRSLSNVSITTDDITFEMEEFSKAWADTDETLPPEVTFSLCPFLLSLTYPCYVQMIPIPIPNNSFFVFISIPKNNFFVYFFIW